MLASSSPAATARPVRRHLQQGLRLMLLTSLLLSGCRLAVGSFDECSTNADCATRGAELECVDKLCVCATSADCTHAVFSACTLN